MQVGVEEDQVDVALQVLQAPQLQRPRLLLVLARFPLEEARKRLRCLRYPLRESIREAAPAPVLIHGPALHPTCEVWW